MTALRFLLLEDNSLDAEAVKATLIDGGIDYDLLRVVTRTDFVTALKTDTFDLILADYTLPDFDGLSALEIACNLCPDTPFIFVSASLGEELELSGNRTKNPQKLYLASVSADFHKNLCKPYGAGVSAIFLVITRQVYWRSKR